MSHIATRQSLSCKRASERRCGRLVTLRNNKTLNSTQCQQGAGRSKSYHEIYLRATVLRAPEQRCWSARRALATRRVRRRSSGRRTRAVTAGRSSPRGAPTASHPSATAPWMSLTPPTPSGAQPLPPPIAILQPAGISIISSDIL